MYIRNSWVNSQRCANWPFFVINHNYPGIHPNWVKQTIHNLINQEAIEKEIDSKKLATLRIIHD